MSRKKEMFPFSYSKTFTERFEDLMVTDSIILRDKTIFAVYDKNTGNINLKTDIFNGAYLRDSIVYQRSVITVDTIYYNNISFNAAFLINKTVINPNLYDLNNNTDFDIVSNNSLIVYDNTYLESLTSNYINLKGTLTTNNNATLSKINFYDNNIDNSIINNTTFYSITNNTYINEGYIENNKIADTLNTNTIQNGTLNKNSLYKTINTDTIQNGTLSKNHITKNIPNIDTLTNGFLNKFTLSNTTNLLSQNGQYYNATLTNTCNSGTITNGYLKNITFYDNYIDSIKKGTITNNHILDSTITDSYIYKLNQIGTISKGIVNTETLSSGDFYGITTNLGTISSGNIYSSTLTDVTINSSIYNSSTLSSGSFLNATLTGSYLYEYPCNLGIIRDGVMTNNIVFVSTLSNDVSNIGKINEGTLSNIYLDDGIILSDVTIITNTNSSTTLSSNNSYSNMTFENSIFNSNNNGTLIGGNISSDLINNTYITNTITNGFYIENTISNNKVYNKNYLDNLLYGNIFVNTITNEKFCHNNTLTGKITYGSITNGTFSDNTVYVNFDNSKATISSGFIRECTATGTYYLNNDITHVGTFTGGYFIDNTITNYIVANQITGIGYINDGIIDNVKFIDETYINDNFLIGSLTNGNLYKSTLSNNCSCNIENNTISSGTVHNSTLTDQHTYSLYPLNVTIDGNLDSNTFINFKLNSTTNIDTIEDGYIDNPFFENSKFTSITNSGILSGGYLYSNTLTNVYNSNYLNVNYLNNGTLTNLTLDSSNINNTSLNGTITNGYIKNAVINSVTNNSIVTGGIYTSVYLQGNMDCLSYMNNGNYSNFSINNVKNIDTIYNPILYNNTLTNIQKNTSLKNGYFNNINVLNNYITNSKNTFIQNGNIVNNSLSNIFLNDILYNGTFTNINLKKITNYSSILNGYYKNSNLLKHTIIDKITYGNLKNITLMNNIDGSNVTNGFITNINLLNNNIDINKGYLFYGQLLQNITNINTITGGFIQNLTLTNNNNLNRPLSSGTLSNISIDSIVNNSSITNLTVSNSFLSNSTVSSNLYNSSITGGINHYSTLSTIVSNNIVNNNIVNGYFINNTITGNYLNNTKLKEGIYSGIIDGALMTDIDIDTLSPDSLGTPIFINTITNSGTISGGIVTKATLSNGNIINISVNSSGIINSGYYANNILNTDKFYNTISLNGTITNGYISSSLLRSPLLLDTISVSNIYKGQLIKPTIQKFNISKVQFYTSSITNGYLNSSINNGTFSNISIINNVNVGSITGRVIKDVNFSGYANQLYNGSLTGQLYNKTKISLIKNGTFTNNNLIGTNNLYIFMNSTLTNMTLSNKTTNYGIIKNTIISDNMIYGNLSSLNNQILNGTITTNSITGIYIRNTISNGYFYKNTLTKVANVGTISNNYMLIDTLIGNTNLLGNNISLSLTNNTLSNNVLIGTITKNTLSNIVIDGKFDYLLNGTITNVVLSNNNTFSTLSNVIGTNNTITNIILLNSITNATITASTVSINSLNGNTVGTFSNINLMGNSTLTNILKNGTFTNNYITKTTIDNLSGYIDDISLNASKLYGTITNSSISNTTFSGINNFNSITNGFSTNNIITNAITNLLTNGTHSFNTLSNLINIGTISSMDFVSSNLFNNQYHTITNLTTSSNLLSISNTNSITGGNLKNAYLNLNSINVAGGNVTNISLLNNSIQGTLSNSLSFNTIGSVINNGFFYNGNMVNGVLNNTINLGTITNGYITKFTLTNTSFSNLIGGVLDNNQIFLSTYSPCTITVDYIKNSIVINPTRLNNTNGFNNNLTFTNNVLLGTISNNYMRNISIVGTNSLSQLNNGTITSTLTNLNYNQSITNGTFTNTTLISPYINTISKFYLSNSYDTLYNKGTITNSSLSNLFIVNTNGNYTLSNGSLSNSTFNNVTITSISINNSIFNGYLINTYNNHSITGGSFNNVSLQVINNAGTIESSVGYLNTITLLNNTLTNYIANAGSSLSNFTLNGNVYFSNIDVGTYRNMTLTGNNYIAKKSSNVSEIVVYGTLSNGSLTQNNINRNTVTGGNLSNIDLINNTTLVGSISNGTFDSFITNSSITQMGSFNSLYNYTLIKSNQIGSLTNGFIDSFVFNNANINSLTSSTFTTNTFMNMSLSNTITGGYLTNLSLTNIVNYSTLTNGSLSTIYSYSIVNSSSLTGGYLNSNIIGNIDVDNISGGVFDSFVLNKISNLNTITNLSITNIVNLGTIDSGNYFRNTLTGNTNNMNYVTGSTLTNNSITSNIVYGGTISNLGSMTNVYNLGTMSNGSLTKNYFVGNVYNLNTISGGTLSSLSFVNNLYNLNTISDGKLNNNTLLGNIIFSTISGGSFSNLTLTNITNFGSFSNNTIDSVYLSNLTNGYGIIDKGYINKSTLTNLSNLNTITYGTLSTNYLVGVNVFNKLNGTITSVTLNNYYNFNTLSNSSLTNITLSNGTFTNFVLNNTLTNTYLNGGFNSLSRFTSATLSNVSLINNTTLSTLFLGTITNASLSNNILVSNSLTSLFLRNNSLSNTLSNVSLYDNVTIVNTLTTMSITKIYNIGSLSNGTISSTLNNVILNGTITGGTLTSILNSTPTGNNYLFNSLTIGDTINDLGTTLKVKSSTANTGGWGGIVVDSMNSGKAGGTVVLRNSSSSQNKNFTALAFDVDGTSVVNSTTTTPALYDSSGGFIYTMKDTDRYRMGVRVSNGTSNMDAINVSNLFSASSSKVGINNTAPVVEMDVTGSIVATGGTLTNIYNPSSKYVNYGTISGGTLTGTIQSSSTANNYTFGDFGVDTMYPTAPMHVVSQGGSDLLTNGILVANTSNSAGNDSILLSRTYSSVGVSSNPFVSFSTLNSKGWSLGVDNTDYAKLKFSTDYNSVSTNPALTFSSITSYSATTGFQFGFVDSTPTSVVDIKGQSLTDFVTLRNYSLTTNSSYKMTLPSTSTNYDTTGAIMKYTENNFGDGYYDANNNMNTDYYSDYAHLYLSNGTYIFSSTETQDLTWTVNSASNITLTNDEYVTLNSDIYAFDLKLTVYVSNLTNLTIALYKSNDKSTWTQEYSSFNTPLNSVSSGSSYSIGEEINVYFMVNATSYSYWKVVISTGTAFNLTFTTGIKSNLFIKRLIYRGTSLYRTLLSFSTTTITTTGGINASNLNLNTSALISDSSISVGTNSGNTYIYFTNAGYYVFDLQVSFSSAQSTVKQFKIRTSSSSSFSSWSEIAFECGRVWVTNDEFKLKAVVYIQANYYATIVYNNYTTTAETINNSSTNSFLSIYSSPSAGLYNITTSSYSANSTTDIVLSNNSASSDITNSSGVLYFSNNGLYMIEPKINLDSESGSIFYVTYNLLYSNDGTNWTTQNTCLIKDNWGGTNNGSFELITKFVINVTESSRYWKVQLVNPDTTAITTATSGWSFIFVHLLKEYPFATDTYIYQTINDNFSQFYLSTTSYALTSSPYEKDLIWVDSSGNYTNSIFTLKSGTFIFDINLALNSTPTNVTVKLYGSSDASTWTIVNQSYNTPYNSTSTGSSFYSGTPLLLSFMVDTTSYSYWKVAVYVSSSYTLVFNSDKKSFLSIRSLEYNGSSLTRSLISLDATGSIASGGTVAYNSASISDSNITVSSNYITINNPGYYIIDFQISFSSAPSATHITLYLQTSDTSSFVSLATIPMECDKKWVANDEYKFKSAVYINSSYKYLRLTTSGASLSYNTGIAYTFLAIYSAPFASAYYMSTSSYPASTSSVQISLSDYTTPNFVNSSVISNNSGIITISIPGTYMLCIKLNIDSLTASKTVTYNITYSSDGSTWTTYSSYTYNETWNGFTEFSTKSMIVATSTNKYWRFELMNNNNAVSISNLSGGWSRAFVYYLGNSQINYLNVTNSANDSLLKLSTGNYIFSGSEYQDLQWILNSSTTSTQKSNILVLGSGIYTFDIRLTVSISTLSSLVIVIYYSSEGSSWSIYNSSYNTPFNSTTLGSYYTSGEAIYASFMIDATNYSYWKVSISPGSALSLGLSTGLSSYLYIRNLKYNYNSLDRCLVAFSTTSVTSAMAMNFNTTPTIADSNIVVNSSYLEIKNPGYYVFDMQVRYNSGSAGSVTKQYFLQLSSTTNFSSTSYLPFESSRYWASNDEFKIKGLFEITSTKKYVRLYYYTTVSSSETINNSSMSSFFSVYNVPMASFYRIPLSYSTGTSNLTLSTVFSPETIINNSTNNNIIYFTTKNDYMVYIKNNVDTATVDKYVKYVLSYSSDGSSNWTTYDTMYFNDTWSGSTEIIGRMVISVTDVQRYWKLEVNTEAGISAVAYDWSWAFIYQLGDSPTNISMTLGPLSYPIGYGLNINNNGVGIGGPATMTLDVNGNLNATGGTLTSVTLNQNNYLTGTLTNGTLSSPYFTDTLTSVGYVMRKYYNSGEVLKMSCFNALSLNGSAVNFSKTNDTNQYTLFSVIFNNVESSGNSNYLVKIDGSYTLSRNTTSDTYNTLTSSYKCSNNLSSPDSLTAIQYWRQTANIGGTTSKSILPSTFIFQNKGDANTSQTISFTVQLNNAESFTYFYNSFSVYVKEIKN